MRNECGVPDQGQMPRVVVEGQAGGRAGGGRPRGRGMRLIIHLSQMDINTNEWIFFLCQQNPFALLLLLQPLLLIYYYYYYYYYNHVFLFPYSFSFHFNKNKQEKKKKASKKKVNMEKKLEKQTKEKKKNSLLKDFTTMQYYYSSSYS